MFRVVLFCIAVILTGAATASDAPQSIDSVRNTWNNTLSAKSSLYHDGCVTIKAERWYTGSTARVDVRVNIPCFETNLVYANDSLDMFSSTAVCTAIHEILDAPVDLELAYEVLDGETATFERVRLTTDECLANSSSSSLQLTALR